MKINTRNTKWTQTPGLYTHIIVKVIGKFFEWNPENVFYACEMEVNGGSKRDGGQTIQRGQHFGNSLFAWCWCWASVWWAFWCILAAMHHPGGCYTLVADEGVIPPPHTPLCQSLWVSWKTLYKCNELFIIIMMVNPFFIRSFHIQLRIQNRKMKKLVIAVCFSYFWFYAQIKNRKWKNGATGRTWFWYLICPVCVTTKLLTYIDPIPALSSSLSDTCLFCLRSCWTQNLLALISEHRWIAHLLQHGGHLCMRLASFK